LDRGTAKLAGDGKGGLIVAGGGRGSHGEEEEGEGSDTKLNYTPSHMLVLILICYIYIQRAAPIVPEVGKIMPRL
jgi:hypothetical protein